MITLNNLSYTYKGNTFRSVEAATAEIPTGIHLLLGENSAGKTTLLHLIAGLLTPTEGNVDIDGETPAQRTPSVLSKLFFVGESTRIPTASIREFVKHHSPLYPTFDEEVLNECLHEFGQSGDESFVSLSMGNRKKAILAYALALKVDVLLLDEPANGLDIGAKQALQRMLSKHVSEQQTVVISTHTPDEFAYLFDGIIMIRRAALLFALPTWQITERLSFEASVLPPEKPLYMEQVMGQFRYMVAAEGGETSTLDYQLLYNGLLSQSANKIINQLTNNG